MAQSRELLTSTQRREYLSVPDNIAEFQLNKYFTLSTDDINIIKQHRGDYNKLGFAMQLCIIRYTGWTLSNIEYISETAICFVASQLNILPMEFNKYAERSNTLYEHADEIMSIYDYNKFTESKSDVLIQLLIEKAQEFNNPLQLISCAIVVRQNIALCNCIPKSNYNYNTNNYLVAICFFTKQIITITKLLMT